MDSRRALTVLVAAVAIAVAAMPATAGAKKHPRPAAVEELATFVAPTCTGACGSGSAVGPDGALYVTDGQRGQLQRVDPRSGAVTTVASGLPPQIPEFGVGGAMDVAFLGHTAYVLVTGVGPELGQPPDVVNGIYRVHRDGSVELVADIGTWSVDNPPETGFFVPSGVQYSLQAYFGGFLVADGHHNRVLFVTRHGDIRELIAFGNIVPTGLETFGAHILMGQAGPIPHEPEDGKVVTFTPWSDDATDVASGAPLIVDVELGPRWRLYALSQGIWDLEPIPANEGMPASANTGRLLRVDRHGGFDTVVAGLDRPTSVDFIGGSAYVVTLTGKVLRIDLGRSHRGRPH
jgi:hypothetical protein